MTAVTSSSSSCSCGSGDNFAFFAELCFVFALKTFAGTSCGTLGSVAQPRFGRQLVCNHFALLFYDFSKLIPGIYFAFLVE